LYRKFTTTFSISFIHGNKNMFRPENPDLADSEALGFYAVLRRVQEPILESIFWLALGYALERQDKARVRRMNASEAAWPNTVVCRRNPGHSP
jgi:hypothetical protein